jgi:hypothetical protein
MLDVPTNDGADQVSATCVFPAVPVTPVGAFGTEVVTENKASAAYETVAPLVVYEAPTQWTT